MKTRKQVTALLTALLLLLNGSLFSIAENEKQQNHVLDSGPHLRGRGPFWGTDERLCFYVDPNSQIDTAQLLILEAGKGVSDETESFSLMAYDGEEMKANPATAKRKPVTSVEIANPELAGKVSVNWRQEPYLQNAYICSFALTADGAKDPPLGLFYVALKVTISGGKTDITSGNMQNSNQRHWVRLLVKKLEGGDFDCEVVTYIPGGPQYTLKKYLGAGGAVTVPEDIQIIGEKAFAKSAVTSVTCNSRQLNTIWKDAFLGCSKLKKVQLPDSLEIIYENAFQECASLQDIRLPANLFSLGYLAFFRCGSLKEITIPGGVAFLEEETFRECSNLQKVVLEEGVEKIGELAFLECIRLQQVVIPASVTSIDATAFQDCPMVTIYCTKGSYADTFATSHNLKVSYGDPGPQTGDVNGDGRVNSADALLILRHSAKISFLSGSALVQADYNRDGQINSADALSVLRDSAS